MPIAAKILIALIALLHLYIMWFEMFRWTTRGPKVFRSFPRDMFPSTRVLAANQGLYNGFLAVGLLWSLVIQDPQWQSNVATCFLLFVLTAGVYGAVTASRVILFVQALPALLGLILIFLI